MGGGQRDRILRRGGTRGATGRRQLRGRTLDAPTARDDDEAAPLVELLGGEDAGYDLVAEREAIASGWNELPDVECSVLELRFVHGLNQREIGERIGYSQMHVSRVLRRALSRLETAAAAA